VKQRVPDNTQTSIQLKLGYRLTLGPKTKPEGIDLDYSLFLNEELIDKGFRELPVGVALVWMATVESNRAQYVILHLASVE
jgi:hypothetical protein